MFVNSHTPSSRRYLSSLTSVVCLLAWLILTTDAHAQQLGGRPIPLDSRLIQQPMRLEVDELDSESAAKESAGLAVDVNAADGSKAAEKNGDAGPGETDSSELDSSELDSSETDSSELDTSELDSGQGGAKGNEFEDENDSESKPNRDSTLSHLMKLRTSVSEIRISTGADVPADDRPANLSGELLSAGDATRVGALNDSWQPLSRYPVAFSHRPLYFQQPDLERCGRTFQCGSRSLGCMQNAVSGFTFLVNTMVLPYRLATERPDCPVPCQGDCGACQTTGSDCDPLEPGKCGLLTEAAAVAGFTFLLL